MTSKKSRTFERLVLLCKRPLESRTNYVRYGLLTGHLLVPYSFYEWPEYAADLVNRAGSSAKTVPMIGFFTFSAELSDWINGAMPDLATASRH